MVIMRITVGVRWRSGGLLSRITDTGEEPEFLG